MAIIIDSDKSCMEDDINDTKKRLIGEIGKGSGFSWVTAGREIENYVPHDVLQDAVKKHNTKIYKSPSTGGQFDHSLWYYRTHENVDVEVDTLEKVVDKVGVAKTVCDVCSDISILDLADQLRLLIDFIRKANT